MTATTASAGRRVGLYGGTFDPVHVAHLALARSALDALALDELRWIPSGRPWQKGQGITPAVHREAMLELAIAGEPRFVLDRSETTRAGASYTIDTVRDLHRAEPATRWVLLIGQDQYARLHTWHEWRSLLPLVTLAVAQRPGELPQADPAVEAAARLAPPLPMAPMAVSSSDIRARVRAGLDISQLVPPQVARYIENHRLYRAPEDAGDRAPGRQASRS